MKILEKKEWSMQITCHDCKSKLLIEANDVKLGEFGSMGDYDWEYYVVCANCGTTINFGSFPRNIPQHVQQKARRR